MVNSLNIDNANIMQLLMSAMQNASSSSAASSSTGIGSESTSSSGDALSSDFLNLLQKNFSEIDANEDSKLTEDEVTGYIDKNKPMGPPPGMMIEDADSTSSQSSEIAADEGASEMSAASGSESASKSNKVFDELDTNKDGVVSFDEVQAALEKTQTASGNPTGSDTSDSSDKKAQDVLSTVWSKLNASSNGSESLLQSLSKNIAEVYKNQSSSGNSSLLSSVMNMAI